MSDIDKIALKPKHDRRVKSGHPWVFSNELSYDVKALPAGGVVDVVDHKGAFVGRGYANPNSLIAVRILSRRRHEDLDHPAFYAQRLRDALALREAVYPGRTAYRLVHSEGDYLPGLTIDRFGDYLAVHIDTLGMEVRKDVLRQAIDDVLAPKGVVLRNEGRARALEGLPMGSELWYGDVPETVEFDEFGVAFQVDLLGSEKTGHYFDQAENRSFAGPLCRGKRVLDVYSNSGAWALYALYHGAEHAIAIDKAEENAHIACTNAELNGMGDRFEAWAGEGKAALQELVEAGERFGAVVLDPPAFAKTRKTANAALRGYEEVNGLAVLLIEPGGFLFTNSCSFHVQEDRFIEAVSKAAGKVGRKLRMVRRGEQASDHPVVPAVPETRYLKSFAFQVLLDA